MLDPLKQYPNCSWISRGRTSSGTIASNNISHTSNIGLHRLPFGIVYDWARSAGLGTPSRLSPRNKLAEKLKRQRRLSLCSLLADTGIWSVLHLGVNDYRILYCFSTFIYSTVDKDPFVLCQLPGWPLQHGRKNRHTIRNQNQQVT